MNKLRRMFNKQQQKNNAVKEREAKLTVLEELFNDLYNDKKRIYKLNFFRGVVFGLGSAVGGTLALALIVWVLSLFVNVPLIGQLFENAQQSIEQTTEQAPRN